MKHKVWYKCRWSFKLNSGIILDGERGCKELKDCKSVLEDLVQLKTIKKLIFTVEKMDE